MLGFGRAVLALILPVVICLATVTIYFRRKMARHPPSRRDLDRRLFNTPIFGTGYTILVNLRFARTFAVLLHGGISAVDGFVLAGRATGSPWVEHLAEPAAESVRHGGTFADALRTIPPLSVALPGWVQAGEAGGNLEVLLLNAGDRYQRQWTRFVARTLGILEPAIILILGVFVLFVALAMLLPIVAANQIIQ
jgi:type II secretory pathway component PulF